MQVAEYDCETVGGRQFSVRRYCKHFLRLVE